jgi:putative membrane protein
VLDLTLAVLHHVLIIGLATMLAMELGLLRAERIDAARLARIDAGYGISAVLVLAVGVCRVAFAAKGWDFYEGNPFFWAKMATFALIGVLSIWPTGRYIGWRRATRDDPAFQPPAAQVAGVRRLVAIQVGLLLPLVAFAAAMARWPF